MNLNPSVAIRLQPRFVTFVFALILLPTIAIGAPKCGSLDRATNAIRLTQILHPELKGEEFSLQFSEGTGGPLSGPSDVRYFLINIDKPQWHAPGDTGQSSATPQLPDDGSAELDLPLYLAFDFIPRSVLSRAGTFVRRELSCQPINFINNKTSKQMSEAREIINAHPEWTDEQDVEAARKLGMRFGSDKKADLLRILPLKGLSSIYGPLQITEAKFRTTLTKEPGDYFAELYWFVMARGIGSSLELQIMVELFHGRIFAISQ
jgi:hypothetical protein